MKFKAIYPDFYSDNQQEKFLNRYNNHWRYRIDNCFKYIDKIEGKVILDLGCSIGTFAIESILRGAKEAIGVDLDLYALQMARKNAKSSGVENRCSFLCCSVSEIELKSDSIDIIIAEDIFEHLLPSTLSDTLSECKRVLKKGGIMIGHTFPTKYDPLFDRKALFFKLLKILIKGKNKRNYILELYNRYLGEEYEKTIMNSTHCNPLDYNDLFNLIKQTGFNVSFYKTHQLYDFDTNNLLRKLLIKIPESHRHISFKLIN